MTATCLNGDCLELMKELKDKSIDLFICDLPYGCLRGGDRGIGKKAGEVLGGCAWDIKIDLEKFWIEIKRLSKNDKTPVLMFCNTKFGIDLINSNPSWFRYDLVWNKNLGTSFLSANKMPMKSHEMIYVFCKKSCNYNRIDQFVADKKAYKYYHGNEYVGTVFNNAKANLERTNKENTRCVLSVININNKKREKHPTAKPIELYDWLIERYSNVGDTVLDPTAGSFNSGLSSLGLERNYVGMEMNEEFFNNNKI